MREIEGLKASALSAVVELSLLAGSCDGPLANYLALSAEPLGRVCDALYPGWRSDPRYAGGAAALDYFSGLSGAARVVSASLRPD